MSNPRSPLNRLGCWFPWGCKVVAWAIVVYLIVGGLQACKSHDVPRAKFQSDSERIHEGQNPKHHTNRRHPR